MVEFFDDIIEKVEETDGISINTLEKILRALKYKEGGENAVFYAYNSDFSYGGGGSLYVFRYPKSDYIFYISRENVYGMMAVYLRSQDEITIADTYLHESVRETGIFKAMLETAEALYRGVKSITLEISPLTMDLNKLSLVPIYQNDNMQLALNKDIAEKAGYATVDDNIAVKTF